MMDYMSQFPPPTLSQAISIIADHLEATAMSNNIDRNSLEHIIEKEIEKFGGPEKFGSYSGWTYFTFKNLVEKTKIHLQ
jgi:hypothetical protein